MYRSVDIIPFWTGHVSPPRLPAVWADQFGRPENLAESVG